MLNKPLEEYGEYELIWEVMTSYVPVTVGLIGVLAAIIVAAYMKGKKSGKEKGAIDSDKR